MPNTYEDRMRWREDAARREAGELPETSRDAYAMAALAELAKRMGLGDVVGDQLTDAIGEDFIADGISPHDSEWLPCFEDLERRVARLSEKELFETLADAVQVVP